MTEAKARGCIQKVTSHLCWVFFADASEAFHQKVSLLSAKSLSERVSVSCPGQGGNAGCSRNERQGGKMWKS